MTLYLSSTHQVKTTTFFPNAVHVKDIDTLRYSQQFDHIMCKMENDKRASDNFIMSDCLFADIDNSHSEDSFDWVTMDSMNDKFAPYEFFIASSKSNGIVKESAAARERFHIFFPITKIDNVDDFNLLMRKLLAQEFAYGFDTKVKDPSRMFFGNDRKDIVCRHHQGVMIDSALHQFSDPGIGPDGEKVKALNEWEGIPWEQMPEGNRNNRLYTEALAELVAGKSPRLVVELARKKAQACKYSFQETSDVLDSAFKKYEEKILKKHDRIISETEEEVKEVESVYDLIAKQLLTTRQIAHSTFTPLKHYIQGILVQGFVWLSGGAKVGKSWLVLQMAQSIASGTPMLGREVRQANVLYLALEDQPGQFQSRRTQQGFDYLDNCYVLMRSKETDSRNGDLGYVAHLVKKTGAEVVFIDTHSAFMPHTPQLQGDAYQTASEIFQPYMSMQRELGITLVMVTHNAKNSNAMTGSEGKKGKADDVIVLTKDGYLNTEGRNIQGESIKLRFDTDRGLWELDSESKEPETMYEILMSDIVGYLRALKPSAVESKDIQSTFKGTAGTTTINKVLSELRSKGGIEYERVGNKHFYRYLGDI